VAKVDRSDYFFFLLGRFSSDFYSGTFSLTTFPCFWKKIDLFWQCTAAQAAHSSCPTADQASVGAAGDSEPTLTKSINIPFCSQTWEVTIYFKKPF